MVGRVVAHESGEAIAGAVVRVASVQYTTDQRGRFVLALPGPGAQTLSVEMIGYTTRTDSLNLAAGTNDVTVRLSRNPVQLPPLSVTVRSRWLEDNGFYERRFEGGTSGHYIDRVEIEKRNPTFVTDLFHGVAGTKVHNLGMAQRVIQFNRSRAGGLTGPSGGATDSRVSAVLKLPGCQPYLYVDGRRHADYVFNGENIVLDFNVLSPEVIDAIEVYVGTSTPTQFRNDTGCGVVLIWTRRGR